MNRSITLFPKTKKGRDIIRRDGSAFIILEECKNVACFNGGSGILIKPANDQNTQRIRWIRTVDDVNFLYGETK